MNLRNLIERIRDSQFLLPAVMIVLSVGIAIVTNRLDEIDVDRRYLIPASVAGARTLVATVAGAIITAATLVFSFSAVTVQLAASQYSPRVVQEFLRDRVQQTIAGLVMGTFTFSVTSLATLGADPSDGDRSDWTATVAVVLGIASAVAIVGFIDHITRRLRIDDTIRRIAERTANGFASMSYPSRQLDESWNVLPETESVAVRSEETGFVQDIDVAELLRSLPSGTITRLDVWIGDFVTAGGRLCTVWAEEVGAPPTALRDSIAVGPTRTIDQDPALGIRQLVDIALRALSPGINDPGTAADVVRHLAACIRAAYRADDPPKSYVADNGSRLVAARAPGAADHLRIAFQPIRRAAQDHVMVLEAMERSVSSLLDEMLESDRDSAALQREIERTRDLLQASEQQLPA